MIIQVGIYPPPIGGVAIYNKRFKEFLDEKGIKNELWDYSSIKNNSKDPTIKNIDLRFAPLLELFKSKSKIIHYHIPSVKPKRIIGFFNRILPKKGLRLLTQHGAANRLFEKANGNIVSTLNTFDAIICVKKNDAAFMKDKGVNTTLIEIPAFIPPKLKDEDFSLIPEHVWNFMKSHKPIISLNGANYNLINGRDLYGMDLTVELLERLIQNYPDIGFVFFRPYVRKGILDDIKNYIETRNLTKNILIVHDSVPFYPVLLKSDIFLRPTLTDGDAVSIREAIHFKIPTLTSDAVERPDGCVLFKKGSLDDLYDKTIMMLENYDYYKNIANNLKENNYAEEVLNFYKELLNDAL